MGGHFSCSRCGRSVSFAQLVDRKYYKSKKVDAAVVGTHHESGLDWCTSCCEAILEERITKDKQETFQRLKSICSRNGGSFLKTITKLSFTFSESLVLSFSCDGCKRKITPVHDILYIRGRKYRQYWPYYYHYLDDKSQVLGSFSVSRLIKYEERTILVFSYSDSLRSLS